MFSASLRRLTIAVYVHSQTDAGVPYGEAVRRASHRFTVAEKTVMNTTSQLRPEIRLFAPELVPERG